MESMAGKFTEQLAGYWREKGGGREGEGEREGEKWRKGEGEGGKGSREWRAKCRDG